MRHSSHHRLRRHLAAVTGALLAGLISAGSPALAAAEPFELRRALTSVPAAVNGERVPGRLLVTYDRDTTSRQRRAALGRVDGATVHDRLPSLDVTVLDVEPALSAEAARALTADPAVANVEHDVRLYAMHADCRSNTACAIPDDPGFRYQWGLQNDAATMQPVASFTFGADIAAPLAWSRTLGGASTRVAVLDSGIDIGHEDLAGRVVASKTAFADSVDRLGHGTHVAGIIGASSGNGLGIAGVAAKAALLNVKMLDDRGSTSCSIAADAIVHATDQGANVINASFGGSTRCQTMAAAVDYAISRDVLVIAAAGNAGNTEREYPAALPGVIAVAATTAADTRADFSSHGAAWVDIAAPGEGIVSTVPGGYASGSGTSMAAPYVSGVAALIWDSVPDANRDGFRSDDVSRRLLEQADRIAGTGTLWEHGRLNACRALAPGADVCAAPVASEPVVPSTPPPPAAPVVAAPAAVAPAPAGSPQLSPAAARRSADAALTRRYRSVWKSARAKRLTCRVPASDRSRATCDVSWRKSRHRYKGRVALTARADTAAVARITVRRVKAS
jgi:thermitase